MTWQKENRNPVWMLTPLAGSLLFAGLYLWAALLYPGGSQFDVHAKKFSFLHNYWCNLLNDQAMNGEPNPAKPVAVAAMFILGITLSVFWYLFPKQTGFKKRGQKTIQCSGILSMVVALFLFTSYHDVVINMAAATGFVAFTGTLIGLYRMKWLLLFWMGILNLLLIGLNNYVYYTKGLLLYLPFIQKITFLLFLLWICFIDVRLYRKQKFVLAHLNS